MQQQVNDIIPHPAPSAPELRRSEHKVKGGRQRLKKEADVDLDTGIRTLDKLETVTAKEMEKGIREQLRR